MTENKLFFYIAGVHRSIFFGRLYDTGRLMTDFPMMNFEILEGVVVL